MAILKFSPEIVEAALRASAGIRSAAAAKLGCSVSTISNYIARYARLRAVEAEIVEQNLDLAETKLLMAIREGRLPAVIFYLKTKGKGRGYSEREVLAPAEEEQIDVRKLSDEELELIVQGKWKRKKVAGTDGRRARRRSMARGLELRAPRQPAIDQDRSSGSGS